MGRLATNHFESKSNRFAGLEFGVHSSHQDIVGMYQQIAKHVSLELVVRLKELWTGVESVFLGKSVYPSDFNTISLGFD